MNNFLSVILIALMFFLLSKFVTWYPTFNSFLFYFLAFWFAWSIRLIPSRIIAVRTAIKLNKSTGYPTSFKYKFPLLIICLSYLVYTIIINADLYQSMLILGLIGFLLFVILSTLTIIGTMLISSD